MANENGKAGIFLFLLLLFWFYGFGSCLLSPKGVNFEGRWLWSGVWTFTLNAAFVLTGLFSSCCSASFDGD